MIISVTRRLIYNLSLIMFIIVLRSRATSYGCVTRTRKSEVKSIYSLIGLLNWKITCFIEAVGGFVVDITIMAIAL